jgi:hypothetical protein
MREQPSLTTSSGGIWLVVGGLFAAVSLAVLVPMAIRFSSGIALAAAIADVVLYAEMVVVRLTVRRLRLRLGLMAGGMLAIAAISLAAVLFVAATAPVS